MTPQIVVKGEHLGLTTPATGLSIDTRWPLGSYQLDFTIPTGSTHPGILAENAPTVVTAGGVAIWRGTVADVDLDAGTVSCFGLARQADQAAALASGVTTSTPDAAIDAAIGRGVLKWTRPASLSSSAHVTGDETEELWHVGPLLDAWAVEAGVNWYVDPSGAVRKATDPTSPSFILPPGVAKFSWATETQATSVVVRYIDSVTEELATTSASITSADTVEQLVDLRPLGKISSTRAGDIATAMLQRATSGGWTGSVTVPVGQILTVGGLPADPAQFMLAVGRGCMIRNQGQVDPRPGRYAKPLDIVLGQAVWNVDDQTITLTPQGSDPADFASIIESFGAKSV